jgi:molecular chaperone DnaK
MPEIAVGIDLGTSTSEIAVFRHGEPFVIPDPMTKISIVPSIVAIDKSNTLKVGEEAASWVDLPGHGVREIKRLMGSGQTVSLASQSYRPEEISAQILLKLKNNAEEALGQSINEVILSVPANFPDAGRNATLAAGELAGLRGRRLINEPTAAALAFGIKNIDIEEQLVVFDFGGGTLDVSVLEMMNGVLEAKCSFGDTQLGGKNFDELLREHFLQEFQKEHPAAIPSERSRLALRTFAEKAKKILSTAGSFSDVLPYFAFKDGDPVDLEADLTRQRFESLVSDLLDRARKVLVEALGRKQVEPRAVHRILLVGGTTYMPCVRQLVAEFFGKEPKADIQPDLAVAMGTCIQAALAKGMISGDKGIILTDVSPFGLGIDMVSSVGAHYMVVYEPLMPPNTTIPYSVNREYSLIHADQEAVNIHLYQDHQGTAKLPADAIDTGIAGRIENIPPSSDGIPYPIAVDFSYDINGMARLRAEVKGTGKIVEIAFQGSDIRMDEAQKADAAKRVQELWRTSSKARDYEDIIAKAERLAKELSSEDQKTLIDVVDTVKHALTIGKPEDIDKSGDRLIDLVFDLESNR